MPKVSVVIPVYNTEKYLKKCLDSVCHQTLADIEIICINDCSTDGSLAILQEYAKLDSRIKLIELFENNGAAKARNIGIELATGEYIGFVDSDDYIDLDFYEKLYTKASEEDADVAKGDIIDIFLDKKETPLKLNIQVRKNKYYFNSCFSTAIYRNFFLKNNNISFLENCIWGEDRLFPIKAAYYSNKIVFVDDARYFYKRRESSTTFSRFDAEKMDSAIESAFIIIDFISAIELTEGNYNLIFNKFLEDVITLIVKNDMFYDFIIEKIKLLLQKYKPKTPNYFVKTISKYIYSENYIALSADYNQILIKQCQIEAIQNLQKRSLNA